MQMSLIIIYLGGIIVTYIHCGYSLSFPGVENVYKSIMDNL